mgnify:CR=1 FL=1
MNYEFITYPDRDMLAIDLARQLAEDLEEALHVSPRAALAVAGCLAERQRRQGAEHPPEFQD